LDIGGDHVVTGARDLVESVARNEGPSTFRLIVGYSGWSPGQLEQEIADGDWLPAPLAPDLLLDGDADALWDHAYRTAAGVANALSFHGTRKGSA
jgi:putative transcriptional regulator